MEDEACRTSSLCIMVTMALPYDGGQGIRRFTGAAVVALWATQRLLPLRKGGELARALEKSHAAAVQLHRRLSRDKRFLTFSSPQLDILVWAPQGEKASAISHASRRSRLRLKRRGLHTAELMLPAQTLQKYYPHIALDRDYVSCLRSCLMKPEHYAWRAEFYELIVSAL